ncbi:HET-domain-containing protein, partial [Thozetella sp. PMI_491]
MWLIDTTTYELKFFADAADVSYAILSHTWNDDEVVFGDMTHPEKAMRKAGWAKIEKTCLLAQAQEPPLPYAWVDTCCIDKTSSAELTEAINSMFHWYRNAEICFVHLQDFPVSSLGIGAHDYESLEFQTALRACRWFKRGWTLQELVASESIEFHGDNWRYVGDKYLLLPLLSMITGVDKSVLESIDNLSAVPVGIRMSWAAGRETTRVEDTAYCLLGIFGVALPLLYGEGPKAFQRLQDEIARSSNDLTLFAWEQVSATRSPMFRGIYAESPAEFANCAHLRVPQEKFSLDNEFTLTNRGLRFD